MMSTPAAQPHSRATSSRFVPVRPSLVVRLVLGPSSKLLNPLVGLLAGRRFVPLIARIHHVGRRSGKRYTTPTGAHVTGDIIVIPLSFGNVSDWSRNVRAAGQCVVQLGGKSYHATQPRFVDATDAKPIVRQSFNAINRFGFRLFGIKQYLILRITNQ
jgi:deazaflavin-dependent oxidoreductase (nitroreductase family)